MGSQVTLEAWKTFGSAYVRQRKESCSSSVTVLHSLFFDSFMKPDDTNVALLRIEDKAKYEDAITYIYAGSDPAAVHKPITIYKEKNSNSFLVAGRYAGVTETYLKYKPLNAEEQKTVADKLGAGKIIRFLSVDKATQ
jgi:hypothetical protein